MNTLAKKKEVMILEFYLLNKNSLFPNIYNLKSVLNKFISFKTKFNTTEYRQLLFQYSFFLKCFLFRSLHKIDLEP